MIGVAGLDEMQRIGKAIDGLGLNRSIDGGNGTIEAEGINGSQRLGDRARSQAYKGGLFFADYGYAVKTTANGIAWREGREAVFGKSTRKIPFMLDSSGFRREISHTAPKWAYEFNNYLAAIELTNPDGFAAWDYPTDRARTIQFLSQLSAIFPDDPRVWPIFSIRWTWDDSAHQAFNQTPKWAGKNLAYLIPTNRTQRLYSEGSRELWVRQAIANAIIVANDPDFRMMVERFGQVMLGGMVAGPCPRMARHVFLSTICQIYPDVRIWGLGQANYATVNGLGQLGMLDRVWTDSSWWIRDAIAERIAFVEKGLITMISLESKSSEKERGASKRESFFSLSELMAANLRSLLAAYAGMIQWPQMDWPADLPLSPLPIDRAKELKRHYQAAQLELGL